MPLDPVFLELRALKDRIRRLETWIEVTKYPGIPKEKTIELAMKQMGHEIARKLFEFNKVVKHDMGDSWRYQSILELLLPLTPAENLNAQPEPTHSLPSR